MHTGLRPDTSVFQDCISHSILFPLYFDLTQIELNFPTLETKRILTNFDS